MTTTLVIPQGLSDEILSAAKSPLETAGVLLVTVAVSEAGDFRLLARALRWVNDAAYLERTSDALLITSDGYVPAIGEAEVIGATALWIHTHPGDQSSPLPSDQDLIVDSQIAELFRLRSGSRYYGAAIFSPSDDALAFSGHLEGESEPPIPIDRLWLVGDRLRLAVSRASTLPMPSPIFDRNVRAFGGAIQAALADLYVGIVGCGGTGSAVAEQLVRLGVRKFLLIDPDLLSASNVTRVYGSTPQDEGQQKVKILRSHLLRIAPNVEISIVADTVSRRTTVEKLIGVDVIFGCTDDNAGRLVLSRFATYFLTPVIDCGVLLSSDQDRRLIGIDGRVTVLTPGQACLVCRDRIDTRRAASELLATAEQMRLVGEGYAPALGAIEPAVVAFTTSVAATAVSELLERLVGYGPIPRPSEVLLRMHDREISTNIAFPRRGHYCDPSAGKQGLGRTDPLLDQTWPA